MNDEHPEQLLPWTKGGPSPNPKGRPTTPKTSSDVRTLARTFTPLAIETLAKIAKNPKAPPASRVAASEALLARAWGRSPVTDGEGAQELVIRVLKFADGLPDDDNMKVIEHNATDTDNTAT
jgi:hypothetical protein